MTPRYWDWRRFVDANPEFIALITALRAERERVFAALVALPRRAQRDRVRQLLHDRKLAVLFVYEGMVRAGRLHGTTPAAITALAERFDLRRPSHEPVLIRQITETDSRVRTVQSFGPLKRAHQNFAARLIRALHPPRENQFLFNGGIPAALKAVEVARDGGMTHAVELDATNFYGSIERSSLAVTLRPLPEAVVRFVVFNETIERGDDRPRAIVRSVPGSPPLGSSNGLPLGAASSPIAGEVLIGQLLADNRIDFGPSVITYADNLLVLGSSEQEAAARADLLVALAEEPAFGGLRLREKGRGHMMQPGTQRVDHFSMGVPFVGQIGLVDSAGDFSWEPNEQKRAQHWIWEHGSSPSLSEIERAEGKVAAYHRSYPFWRDKGTSEAQDRASLSCARYFAFSTPENLGTAVRDVVLAHLCVPHGDPYYFIPDHMPGWGEITIFERKRERINAEANALIATISRARIAS
ncbi:hypothetical protein [Novosphingobium sp. AP12]|uniref:hypothetical protein n=1 Tax=Novosphingobium sp. AP12 TaxID=1144305 RepID=UPI00056D1384|nr:hypothetical protein [Novosphingobium sp. AP12]